MLFVYVRIKGIHLCISINPYNYKFPFSFVISLLTGLILSFDCLYTRPISLSPSSYFIYKNHHPDNNMLKYLISAVQSLTPLSQRYRLAVFS